MAGDRPGRWRRTLWQIFRGDMDWRPTLEEDEVVIREALGWDSQGFGGTNVGPLFLTDRRLLWRQKPDQMTVQTV